VGPTGATGGTGTPGVAFTFQVLHASDLEAGVAAIKDAPRFSAVMKALESEYPTRTVKLINGDAVIPGVFYNAGGDAALNAVAAVQVASPGRPDVAMLNAMGIHAASFGNHEFDNGTKEVVNIIKSASASTGTWSGAKFPYLSANLNFSANADLKGQVVANEFVFKPYMPANSLDNKITGSFVTYLDGEPIGVVGVTTPEVGSISQIGNVVVSPSNPTDWDGVAAIIQTRVDKLRALGVNKIVLMAHMQQWSVEVDELPQRLDGVDVVLAGGSHAVWADDDDVVYPGDTKAHTYPAWKTSKTAEPVAVLNVGSNYRYVGRFIGNFDVKGVLITEAHVAPRCGAFATDDTGVARLSAAALANPVVTEIATTVGAVVTEKDKVILGKTQVYLNGLRASVRTEETNLGNLTSDANIWYAKQNGETTASIALKNSGGIRDSIGTVGPGQPPTYLPPAENPEANKLAGEISQLDIENSLRFNNDLAVVTVTVAQLKQLLEHGVAASAAGATPGQFPQLGGIRMEYDLTQTAQVLDMAIVPPATTPTYNVKTAGARIRKVQKLDANGNVGTTLIDNGAVVTTENLRIVVLSFLATGGDGYPFPRFAIENGATYNLVTLDMTAGNQGFLDVGREQDALAKYLLANYPKTGAGYNVADTAVTLDDRIKKL
jgi:2',3'-cyclic-nucleotide 2'-phosphodiesterase (5'-nucleotidase family)